MLNIRRTSFISKRDQAFGKSQKMLRKKKVDWMKHNFTSLLQCALSESVQLYQCHGIRFFLPEIHMTVCVYTLTINLIQNCTRLQIPKMLLFSVTCAWQQLLLLLLDLWTYAQIQVVEIPAPKKCCQNKAIKNLLVMLEHCANYTVERNIMIWSMTDDNKAYSKWCGLPLHWQDTTLRPYWI